MLRLIFPILILALSGFARVSVAGAAAAQDPVAFTRSAYESLTALDPNAKDFSSTALDRFKSHFDFAAFAALCLTDIDAKMKPEEADKIRATFHDVFFTNFTKKSGNLFRRKIAKPVYAVAASTPEKTSVKITGGTANGYGELTFILKPQTDGSWKMIDLEVESALLSRNYRGSFNRVFREKGFAGLSERLTARLEELKKMP